jgi:hypothetical protein
MRAAFLSIACLVGLGLSAGASKAGTFDIVVKFPSWGYTYVSPYPTYYYPPAYVPYYPPTVIAPAPIIVTRPAYVPVIGIGHSRYPGYDPYWHRHHR